LINFMEQSRQMEEFVHYKKGKVHYNIRGTGEVIVLLHGYLESSEVWESFSEKLSGKFRVICVDLPGHGLSDIYGDTHTMEFMADCIRELIIRLGIKKVFLAGHSLGGYVALAFLKFFPELLKGYCLFHSQPFPDPPEALEKRKREIRLVEAGKKNLMYPDNVEKMFATSNLDKFSEAVEHSKEIASKIPAKGIIAVLNGMMARSSRLEQMEEGKVPCLWILGSMDNYIPCDFIQSKIKLPANAEVAILRDSGHMGFIEEEEKSLKAVIGFVNSIS